MSNAIPDLVARIDALEQANARLSDELRGAQKFALMVADLDRSPEGRHEGDVQSGAPDGVSPGNPHLQTGDVLGFSLAGTYEYRMPERSKRHDPEAWKVLR